MPRKSHPIWDLTLGENTIAIATRQNWRWGMLSMRVYNGGFDFMLSARLAKGGKER